MDILSQIDCKSNLRKVGNAIVEDTNEVVRKIFDEATKVIGKSVNLNRDVLMQKIDDGEELIGEWADVSEQLKVESKDASSVSGNVLFSILRPPIRYGIGWLAQEERGILSEGITSVFSSRRLSYRTISICGRIVLSKYFLDNSNFGTGDELIIPISSIMLENEYFDSFGSEETLARMNGCYCGHIIGRLNGERKMYGSVCVKGMSERKCLRVYGYNKNIASADEAEVFIKMEEGIKYKDEQGNWIP